MKSCFRVKQVAKLARSLSIVARKHKIPVSIQQQLIKQTSLIQIRSFSDSKNGKHDNNNDNINVDSSNSSDDNNNENLDPPENSNDTNTTQASTTDTSNTSNQKETTDSDEASSSSAVTTHLFDDDHYEEPGTTADYLNFMVTSVFQLALLGGLFAGAAYTVKMLLLSGRNGVDGLYSECWGVLKINDDVEALVGKPMRCFGRDTGNESRRTQPDTKSYVADGKF